MTKLGDDAGAWFRAIMGRVIRSFGGGLAIFCVICLFTDVSGKIYFIAGIIIGVLLFVYGFTIKGKKVDMDDNTGRVRKKYL